MERSERLRVEGLSKRYGRQDVVRALSFSIAAGETVGFLGRNGAGKSTTIRMLCNLVRPTAGSVWLDGVSLLGRGSAQQRRRVGAVVEGPQFYPQLSGWRNLELLARLHGLPPGRAGAMLEAVGLADKARARFGEYSMGMKQRLGLAAAFLHEPALVILDEPSNGLDPVGRRQIHELISGLVRGRGVSVLLCTHLLAEVGTLCDRALVIEQGALILDQPLGEPGGMEAVERCFAALAAELTAGGEVA